MILACFEVVSLPIHYSLLRHYRCTVFLLSDYSILKGSSDEESLDDSEEEFRMSDLDLSSSDEMIEDSDDEEYKPNGPRKKRKPDYNSNPTLLLGN